MYELTFAQRESLKKSGLNIGRKVVLGVLGQSNERGNVSVGDRSAYPQAFASLRKPGIAVPLSLAIGLTGGWWTKVIDDQYDRGYDLTIVNGAIGSLSFVSHVAGQIQYWNPGQQYTQNRAPLGAADRGRVGDLINDNTGRMFRCTSGLKQSALWTGPARDPLGIGYTYQDFVAQAGNGASGATQPNWSSVTSVGGTIVDGQATWTLESLAPYGGAGAIMTEDQAGVGFDPFGLCQRLHEAMQRESGRKIIYLANGQGDQGQFQDWYDQALRSITRFFLNRGYEVMIGLTCYTPTGTTANYDKLKAARASALAALQADPIYGSKVYAGADLYTAMGTTGPMATNGAFLQSDNVHLNGQGCIGPAIGTIQPAAFHVGQALNSILL